MCGSVYVFISKPVYVCWWSKVSIYLCLSVLFFLAGTETYFKTMPCSQRFKLSLLKIVDFYPFTLNWVIFAVVLFRYMHVHIFAFC